MSQFSRRRFSGLVAGLVASVPMGLSAFRPVRFSDKKIKVLLLTGQSNHSWQRTTPLIEDILREAGLFQVEISMTPPRGAAPEVWETWRPSFVRYDVIINNYCGDPWPTVVQNRFLSYIEGGGDCLILPTANNAFEGWVPYEAMVGLLGRDSTYGERVYLDGAEAPVRVPAGQGPGAGHSNVHDWPVTIRDKEHPITKGMPPVWMHAHDKLYHGQRGPVRGMNLLATAYSSKENGGTGQHEPVVWWIPYGKGRVLTCLLGHLWPTQEEVTAYRCVGFRTLLSRVTEWLATDQVSLTIPDNFPTAEQTSTISL